MRYKGKHRKKKHVHEWEYTRPTFVGWSIARCVTCGHEELA